MTTRTRTLRACVICGTPTQHGNRCELHPHNGYGWQHQQQRAALRPHAYGQPCPICGEPMQPGQPLDLDHGTQADGHQMSHAHCNRST